jgi:hypothetical protein
VSPSWMDSSLPLTTIELIARSPSGELVEGV